MRVAPLRARTALFEAMAGVMDAIVRECNKQEAANSSAVLDKTYST